MSTVYLAGKVMNVVGSDHEGPEANSLGVVDIRDWRESIVPGLRLADSYRDRPYAYGEWLDDRFVSQTIMAGVFSCGPWLKDDSGGHGCTCSHTPDLDERLSVFVASSRSVNNCDAVFAFINATDCIGTAFELGLAYSIGKPVAVIFSSDIIARAAWFLSMRADYSEVNPDPAAAFKYVFGRCLPFRSLTFRGMPYSEYLKTEHWLSVAQAAKERAGGKCSICNGVGQLHAHHRTYENRGEEKPGDVIALCGSCHARFHEKKVAA